MNKKIDVEELKCIQMVILKSIDLFCKQNNIKYSLAFGKTFNEYLPFSHSAKSVFPERFPLRTKILNVNVRSASCFIRIAFDYY